MKKLVLCLVLVMAGAGHLMAMDFGEINCLSTTTVQGELKLDGAVFDGGGAVLNNIGSPVDSNDAMTKGIADGQYADKDDVISSTQAIYNILDVTVVSTGTNAGNIATNAQAISDLGYSTGTIQGEVDLLTPYTTTFVKGDLSAMPDAEIIFTHSRGTQLVDVTVYNNSNYKIFPDNVYTLGTSSCTVQLKSYYPAMTGTWSIKISK